MIEEAIHSDGTQAYRNPTEPAAHEPVNIRIRVAHGNLMEIHLICPGEIEYRYAMELAEVSGFFDYYQVTIMMPQETFSYYFQLTEGEYTIYYDAGGVTREPRMEYLFRICPGFAAPQWSKGAVMYQIMVDRFYNGDASNNVENGEYHYINTNTTRIDDWNRLPENFDVAEFYGGDLEGVRQKLYYLKSLGVEVIYFNPLFVSPSSHKYDTQDYDYIDPHIGVIKKDGGENLSQGDWDNTHATRYIQRVTEKENLQASNELFIQLVEEAHQKGIRVILDGVFNHCGSFNKWMDRERIYENQEGYAPGAYVSQDSPYRNYFQFHDENQWPYNRSYDGWWENDTLPKLNYEASLELQEYILSIGAKWVSPPYNADGWRLDVAADLGHSPEFNHDFWQRFRNRVKEANPQAIILAEHYGDASAWLQGNEWDTVMNYDAFMEPVSYFLTGMEKHSEHYDEEALGDGERFVQTMTHYMTRFMTPSLQCAMNQLSNHDHSRFLTRTNHKVGRAATLGAETAEQDVSIPVMKLAVMMQMTWPGAPTLYYGDEAGVCGYTDPDNRRTYPWNNANYNLIDYHRDMIMLHKGSMALRQGSFRFLGWGKNYVSYGRFTQQEQYVIAINCGAEEIVVDIPVWQAQVPMESSMQQIMLTNERGYSIMPLERQVSQGMLHIALQGYTGMVLCREELK